MNSYLKAFRARVMMSGLALAFCLQGCGSNHSGSSMESIGGGGSAGASAGEGGSANVGGAAGNSSVQHCPQATLPDVVINELCASNDGNAVDEFGNADDWLELVNRGEQPVELAGLTLSIGSKRIPLPSRTLAPGAHLVLWADEQPTQGDEHLPLKLKKTGATVTLRCSDDELDKLTYPALETNYVQARFPDAKGEFAPCRYASPERDNGTTCEPPTPPALSEHTKFSPYTWTLPHPALPTALAINELSLNPAGFIELVNLSQTTVDPSTYQLRLSPIVPGQPWPTMTDGIAIDLSSLEPLEPGDLVFLPVTTADVSAVAASARFEGVVTLFANDGNVADRVDFVHWPAATALARIPDYPGRFVFCSPESPGSNNNGCRILEKREIPDYDRHLRTLSDFETLSAGSGELGMASVKAILDMKAGDQVYLVGAREWSLHYEFIREIVEGKAPLDRCIPPEDAAFQIGWSNFSDTEYRRSTGRRYLLGTLVHHAAADLYTFEFTPGDNVLPEDMRKMFFASTAHVLNPEAYSLRPQMDDQVQRALQVDDTLPIVDPNAPFTTTKLQPLTAGVGYGTLTYLSAGELETASLGRDVIVVTDDVPNDIPLVGGLITEAFQTPMSHVNVLCQNRGTPNLALPHAREDPVIASLLGQLVRFEVTSDGYHLEPASGEEAQGYWDSTRPDSTPVAPRLDGERNDIVDLSTASFADLPAIGAKAAQFAELLLLATNYVPDCDGASSFIVPTPAFALPMSFFLSHVEQSGARALLNALIETPDVLSDRNLRHAQLAAIRDAILSTPIEQTTLAAITDLIRAKYGTTRVRMRSSSNAEDLLGFNGAGLYSSVSAALDDPEYPIEDAIRTVWASLYSNRGFDERLTMNVDQNKVAMAVLIHSAFPEERANGVVVSRDLNDVIRGDRYAFNAQVGEASVTNPAPGVTSDQFTYQWPPRTPTLDVQSRSSLNKAESVLSLPEIVSTACAMRAIVDHFRPIIDPESTDPYFTMDLEFKFLGNERQLLIKQARPYSFGSWSDPGDCRDL